MSREKLKDALFCMRNSHDGKPIGYKNDEAKPFCYSLEQKVNFNWFCCMSWTDAWALDKLSKK